MIIEALEVYARALTGGADRRRVVPKRDHQHHNERQQEKTSAGRGERNGAHRLNWSKVGPAVCAQLSQTSGRGESTLLRAHDVGAVDDHDAAGRHADAIARAAAFIGDATMAAGHDIGPRRVLGFGAIFSGPSAPASAGVVSGYCMPIVGDEARSGSP